MVEASPKVPAESTPKVLSIPLFASNSLLLSFGKPAESQESLNSELSAYKQNLPCSCPQILVCDDDSFQSMYYKYLFEGLRSISAENSEKSTLRFEIFEAGEDLIKRYTKMRECGCNSLMLAITDYNMGHKKLNGVETIMNLRKSGYAGPVMLRTSETKPYLCKRHSNFEEMLEKGFIDYYIEKNNLKRAKEIIQEMTSTKSI